MGFFNKLFGKKEEEKEQLKEDLSQGLEKSRKGFFSNVATTFAGRTTIDEEVLDDLEDILIASDVGVETTIKIIKRIEDRVARDKYVTTRELNEILRDEIVQLLALNNSNEAVTYEVPEGVKPYVIMVIGVNGVGKTTSIGKLANKYQEAGKKVLLGAGDTFRAAAVDQLEIWANRVGCDFYSKGMNVDPAAVAYETVRHAKENGHDVVFIDTAGRLAVDEAMMTEISNIHKAIQPQETLFVVDSMTGQDAVNSAKAFNDVLNFDGVILTKLDGDTRGGAAISIKSVVNKPIKFIGTGEKMEAIDVFYPSRMADRILGMGDVVSLVERAQEQFDEVEARKLQKKIAKNQFGFDDFLKQIQQIKKMGNMKDLVGMIPGAGKMMKDVDIDDDAFKGIEAIIHSMTPKERSNPSVINASRKKRIGKGSGTSVQQVNQLLKQFNQMSKMMKMMQGGGGKKMMQAMKNMR